MIVMMKIIEFFNYSKFLNFYKYIEFSNDIFILLIFIINGCFCSLIGENYCIVVLLIKNLIGNRFLVIWFNFLVKIFFI